MFLDLHVHTSCSDGAVSPKQLANMIVRAKAAGLNVRVIVTDHDTVRGQSQLLAVCPDCTWPEVYAMEKTMNSHFIFDGKRYHVHTNIYCPFKFDAFEVPNELTRQIDWARRNGCAVQVNHPFFWPRVSLMRSGADFMRYLLSEKYPLMMIEVANANQVWVQDWLTAVSLARALGVKGAPKPTKFLAFVKRLEELSPVALTANTDMHLPMSFAANLNVLRDPQLVERGWKGFEEALRRKAVGPALVRRSPLLIKALKLDVWSGNKAVKAVLKALLKLFPRAKETQLWWTSQWFSC